MTAYHVSEQHCGSGLVVMLSCNFRDESGEGEEAEKKKFQNQLSGKPRLQNITIFVLEFREK